MSSPILISESQLIDTMNDIYFCDTTQNNIILELPEYSDYYYITIKNISSSTNTLSVVVNTNDVNYIFIDGNNDILINNLCSVDLYSFNNQWNILCHYSNSI